MYALCIECATFNTIKDRYETWDVQGKANFYSSLSNNTFTDKI